MTVPDAPPADEGGQFVAQVTRDIEELWQQEFETAGRRYDPVGPARTLAATADQPGPVVFSRNTTTACGLGSAATGPFYCPADERVYIDLTFYNQLSQRFGASGDFAQAPASGRARSTSVTCWRRAISMRVCAPPPPSAMTASRSRRPVASLRRPGPMDRPNSGRGGCDGASRRAAPTRATRSPATCRRPVRQLPVGPRRRSGSAPGSATQRTSSGTRPTTKPAVKPVSAARRHHRLLNIVVIADMVLPLPPVLSVCRSTAGTPTLCVTRPRVASTEIRKPPRQYAFEGEPCGGNTTRPRTSVDRARHAIVKTMRAL